MARRASQPPIPAQAQLSIEQMQQGISRLAKRHDELEAFELQALNNENARAVIAPLKASIDDALVRTFGNETVEYQRYSSASNFSYPLYMGRPTPSSEIREAVTRAIQRSSGLLKQAIRALEERIEEAGGDTTVSTPDQVAIPTDNRRIFIVHGHDTGPKEAIARFFEKLGFEPVILHEQANKGQTIIEKFEANADVGFAVVLLTPDDVGRAKGDVKEQSRARQNVILELGYFIGRLGRERVCALKIGDLEIPSDILGVVWTPFDESGAWKQDLAKELKAADYEIDWNKVMGR